MPTLQETIDAQRAASLAHRLRLGLGEYRPITGTQVLYNVPVEWRDSERRPQKYDCATVHVDHSMAILYVGNSTGSIVRRLGCAGLKIDGR